MIGTLRTRTGTARR